MSKKHKGPKVKRMQVRLDIRDIIKDTRSQYPLRQIQSDVDTYAIGAACAEKLITLCNLYQKKCKKNITALGISWNQTVYSLDHSARVCIYRASGSDVFQILVNPYIVETSSETVESEEGCLSLPGKTKNVGRYTWIVIEHCNESNLVVRKKIADFEAIVCQQEIDHLNGILIIDEERRYTV